MKKSLLFLAVNLVFCFSSAVAMRDPVEVALYDVSSLCQKKKSLTDLELGADNRNSKNDSVLKQPFSSSLREQSTTPAAESPFLLLADHVFPQIIPPATLMPKIATPRREGLNLSNQDCEKKDSSSHHYKYLGDDIQSQARHRRVKSAPDCFPNYRPQGKRAIDDDDCCDDICRECCCVKNYCACCGTSLVIVGLIWLKSIMEPAQ